MLSASMLQATVGYRPLLVHPPLTTHTAATRGAHDFRGEQWQKLFTVWKSDCVQNMMS